MKKFLLSLLLAVPSFPAFAGDRVIINPEQDGDLKIKVNDGGSVTDVMTFQGSSGNVGIGTTAPSSTLTVAGGETRITDTSGNLIHRFEQDGSQTGYRVGNAVSHSYLRYNGSFASPTAVANGETLSQILFRGYDGSNALSAASITATVDNPVGTNDMPGRLIFSTTADGASSPSERMRIANTGNVGIGTSSPSERLEVRATGTSNVMRVTSDQTTARIIFNTSGADRGQITSSTADAIRFNNGAGSEIARISSTGFFATPSTGAIYNGTDASNEIGFFAGSNGGATTDSCQTICDGDRAGHGLSTGTAALCVGGWNQPTGVTITCSDTSNIFKNCVCFGRR